MGGIMNNDIFMYKLTTDNGGAPCVENELLSLCICKPKIRMSAKVGDWIIGMGGKSVNDLRNRLIYLAKVALWCFFFGLFSHVWCFGAFF